MLRGLYTGASGMVAQMHRMDAVSNNLANVDLTGYQKDVTIQKSFPEMLIRRANDDGMYTFPFGSVDTMPIVGKLGTGTEVNEVFTIFEQGAMKPTENVFDFALNGKGFLSMETKDGERYTRNGSFLLNPEGYLVNKSGDMVLGENGPIQLQKFNFVIDQDGVLYRDPTFAGDAARLVSMNEVTWENIERIDRLKIVNVEQPRYLQKQGNSYWKTTRDSGPAEIVPDDDRPKVIQGFLEASNVNPVIEMVKMIDLNRAYEANSKAMQTHDALAAKLINEVGRV